MPETNATLTPAALGDVKFDRARGFGIEIECYAPIEATAVAEALTLAGVTCAFEGYHHTTRANWKIVTDGSLSSAPSGMRGMEIVSPVLRGEDGVAQIKKVCAVLNTLGAKVNKSCGLHVHHDAADLDARDLKAALTIWWKHEETLKFFLAPSRRNNRYASLFQTSGNYVWAGYQPSENLEADATAFGQFLGRATSKSDLSRLQNERYGALNLHALGRHGTFEFRAHGGTTDSGKIIAWVVLTQTILSRAKAKGARISNRVLGAFAQEVRFFWRAIEWVNLTDPIVILAKQILTERWNAFKAAERAGTGEGE